MTADEAPSPNASARWSWRAWPQNIRRRLASITVRQFGLPAQAEPYFRQFFAGFPDAALLIDPRDPAADWPIVDANEAACRLHGYARAELVGRSIDCLATAPAASLDQLRREPAGRCTTRHRRKDGAEVLVESTLTILTFGERELALEIDRDLSASPAPDSEAYQRALFDDFPTSLWEEDFSAVKTRLAQLRQQGVTDWDTYLTEHPELVAECVTLVKIINVNRATLKLFRAANKTDLLQSLERVVSADALDGFRNELIEIAHGHRNFELDIVNRPATGDTLALNLRWSVMSGYEDTLARVLVAVTDLTERQRMEAALRESEAVFRAIFEHSPGGIALIGPGGVYLKVNRGLCEMLGYTEAEMVGHRTLEFMHPDDVAGSYAQAERLASGEIPLADIEKRYIHRSGRVIWAQRVMTAPEHAGSPARFLISLVHDITERKQAERELLKSNDQLTAGLLEMEERTREMERLNEMVSLFQTCRAPEEAYVVVGKLAPALFPGCGGALAIVPPSRNRVETMVTWGEVDYALPTFALDDCWALRRAQPHVVVDGPQGLNCRHLATTPPAYICVPLFAQGEILGALHVNTQAGQLSQRKQQFAKTVADAIALSIANLRLRESLRHQSIVDVLTGLFNRRYMEETLEREVRRCARALRPLSIIMLDLDHFKQFNDTYGHAAGDVLLSEFGALLRANVRLEDIACRYGGEEFTLILPDSSLAATAQRAEVLRASLQGLRVEYQGQIFGPVTASLGVASFPEHGPDGARVLRVADEALYRAKHAGRNQVVVADVPMRKHRPLPS